MTSQMSLRAPHLCANVEFWVGSHRANRLTLSHRGNLMRDHAGCDHLEPVDFTAGYAD